MRWFRWLVVLATALALLPACGGGGRRSQPATPPAPTGPGAAPGPGAAGPRPTVAADLAARVGELVMVGFREATVGDGTPIVGQIREGLVGGVVLYDVDLLTGGARNVVSPTQLRALVAALQAAAPRPLLVGIDQEGGRVDRLPASFGLGGSAPARELGRGPVARTRDQAARTARALAAAGVNLNFAPVVDLDVDPSSPAIGALSRSYSADPAVVTAHARAVVEAHRREGVATVLKHFPGHGSAKGDTHLGLVDVSATWSAAELEPYRALVGEGTVDAVMTAHVFNDRLDRDWPATLSPATVTGLLRDRLGFDGVVVSDDLEMGAVADHHTLETTLRQALAAGVDVLLLGNNNGRTYRPDLARTVVATVVSLVERGVVAEARIDRSVERVRALRARLPVRPR